MDTIRPDALAECGDDELDSRSEVQEVTWHMILQYVIVSGALPRESAEPFATYMIENGLDYNNDGDATVGQVIEGGLSYWCGGHEMPGPTEMEIRERTLRQAAKYLRDKYGVTNRAAGDLNRLAELEAQGNSVLKEN